VLGLARDGFTEDRGRLYSVGRLVLYVPHGSPLKADGSLRDLGAALDDGRLKRFAIANPEHAPYGQRAAEALRSAGLWDSIQDHLVYGENVAQAAQFAASQNAHGGIIAESLARSEKVSALGSFALIPESRYRPLRQRMVLVKGAGPAARQFYEYLALPPARAVFAKYGFSIPRALD
jgi:molybdate transport system substrate-binding protein